MRKPPGRVAQEVVERATFWLALHAEKSADDLHSVTLQGERA